MSGKREQRREKEKLDKMLKLSALEIHLVYVMLGLDGLVMVCPPEMLRLELGNIRDELRKSLSRLSRQFQAIGKDIHKEIPVRVDEAQFRLYAIDFVLSGDVQEGISLLKQGASQSMAEQHAK